GQLLDRFPRGIAKRHAALEWRGGVIDVDDGSFGTVNRFKGPPDECLAGLHKHLDRDVLWDAVLVNQTAQEIKFRVGGRRETHFDLLETDPDKEVEKLQFLLNRHGLRQGLVAITQINRAPNWSSGEGFVRPSAVGQRDRRKGSIF